MGKNCLLWLKESKSWLMQALYQGWHTGTLDACSEDLRTALILEHFEVNHKNRSSFCHLWVSISLNWLLTISRRTQKLLMAQIYIIRLFMCIVSSLMCVFQLSVQYRLVFEFGIWNFDCFHFIDKKCFLSPFLVWHFKTKTISVITSVLAPVTPFSHRHH